MVQLSFYSLPVLWHWYEQDFPGHVIGDSILKHFQTWLMSVKVVIQVNKTYLSFRN